MTRILKWIGLGAAGLLVAAILVGAACEQVARVKTSRKFGAPGRMVSVDGRDIQIDCRGQGSPTVVFESGLDVLGSLSWAAVHDSVATTTRACAYSRAGIMWSGQPTGSFTSSGVARDLRMALTAAKESGPFVMVAHSLGGPYVMTFTGLYPDDVAGVVLVDASHPDQVARLEKATGTSMTPPTGMLAFGSAMARTGLVRMLVGDLAPAPAPPLVHEATAAFAPTSLSAVLGEAKAVQSSFQSAGQYRNLGDRPLIVLTAMAELSEAQLRMQHMTRAQGNAFRSTWKELQEDETRWSRSSRQILVPDASHYIQFDRPDIVITAIRDVVRATRSGGKLAATTN